VVQPVLGHEQPLPTQNGERLLVRQLVHPAAVVVLVRDPEGHAASTVPQSKTAGRRTFVVAATMCTIAAAIRASMTRLSC